MGMPDSVEMRRRKSMSRPGGGGHRRFGIHSTRRPPWDRTARSRGRRRRRWACRIRWRCGGENRCPGLVEEGIGDLGFTPRGDLLGIERLGVEAAGGDDGHAGFGGDAAEKIDVPAWWRRASEIWDSLHAETSLG